jgi:DNA adenine methylase
MNLCSPLRYPGGKSAMASVLKQVRSLNNLQAQAIAEPFAGGAGASLNLLFMEETPDVHINDADPAIFDFWWAVINQTDKFCDLISEKRVTMAEWRRQRAVYRGSKRTSRLARGFAAFFLNRCNRSGIIMNGGPIGGIKQEGEWKLNARYNKEALIARCRRLAEFRSRLHLSKLDGIDFLDTNDAKAALLFIDPPYYHKGKTLYLNSLDQEYHSSLAEKLKNMPDAAWVVTYDDCPEIRRLYKGWSTIRPFSLRYAAAERRSGREILVAPKWLKLPKEQTSGAIGW